MKTGVCYYPEHWPEEQWQQDASQMVSLGLSVVRIGEFAWSRLEPTAGKLEFDWLQRAIDTLHNAGLQVVLGTPTATPPIWLVRKHPDMLAVDEHGHTRAFGSRRHYCFSSVAYREECTRIVTLLADAFGDHPAVTAWQTDNEFGCHSTTISYSNAALEAFRHWCSAHYNNSIDALNTAWGNVFWSMEYTSFADIGLPVGGVTEMNPAHRMAYWRFSSDQVKSFNRLQVDILRKRSPARDIVHNFMGNFVEFDHFDVGKDLDVAAWDNYPLGFLTRDGTNALDQQRFMRTGHPDGSAFHHDLYRACGRGRVWLMEQQPGPVNWAPYNPAPLPGMVRLWGWEAIAHGAELVSYFRWRQAPFAQEQMHTGLCLPNGEFDDAAYEAKLLAEEIDAIAALEINTDVQPAPVALVFDYAGDQAQRIQQPDGKHYDPLIFTQRVYAACRQLGVDVDIVSSDSQLLQYKLILLINNAISEPQLISKLQMSDAEIVLFPRVGSKTPDCSIPDRLAPGAFQQLINLRVTRVESLPPASQITTDKQSTVIDWRERIDAPFPAQETFSDGWGFHYQQGRVHYLNGCLDQIGLLRFIAARLGKLDIAHSDLGPGLRIRKRGGLVFVFNYGPERATLDEKLLTHFGFDQTAGCLVGKATLEAADICIWRTAECIK